MTKIILASASPRRSELLKKIFKDFDVIPSGYDESSIDHSDPIEFAKKASYEKAKDVAGKHPGDIVIGADTIVVLGKKIFGKPRDLAHAREMLIELSGKTHKVITGVTVISGGKSLTMTEETDVTFKDLSADGIDKYLKENSVLDKAGSYAIQEIGERFVKKIAGEKDNVIGLPLKTLREMLKNFR